MFNRCLFPLPQLRSNSSLIKRIVVRVHMLRPLYLTHLYPSNALQSRRNHNLQGTQICRIVKGVLEGTIKDSLLINIKAFQTYKPATTNKRRECQLAATYQKSRTIQITLTTLMFIISPPLHRSNNRFCKSYLLTSNNNKAKITNFQTRQKLLI
jgi:hypothetical protein